MVTDYTKQSRFFKKAVLQTILPVFERRDESAQKLQALEKAMQTDAVTDALKEEYERLQKDYFIEQQNCKDIVQTLKNVIAQKEIDDEESKQMITFLKNEAQKIQEQAKIELETVSNDYANALDLLELAKLKRQELQADNEAYERQLQQIQAEYEEQARRLEACENRHQKAQLRADEEGTKRSSKRAEMAERALLAAQQDFANIKADLDKVQSAYEQARQELQKLQQKIKELEEQNKNLDEQCRANVPLAPPQAKEAAERVTKAEARIKDLKAQVKNAEERATKAERAKNDAEAQARNAEARATKAEERAKNDAEAQVKNADERATKAERAKNDAEAQVKNADERATKAEAQVKNAEERAKNDVKNAEEQVTKAEARAKNAEERATKAEAQVKNAEARATKAEARANEFVNQAEQKLKEALAVQKAAADQEGEETEQILKKLRAQAQNADDQLQQAEAQVKDFEQRFLAADRRAVDAEARATDAEAKAEQLIKAAESARTVINAAEQRAMAAEKARKEAEDALANTKKNEATLAENERLKVEFERAKAEINKLNKQVAAGKEALNTAQVSINALNNAENENANLKERVVKAEKENANLKTQVAGVEAAKEAAEKRATDADQEILQLKNQLENNKIQAQIASPLDELRSIINGTPLFAGTDNTAEVNKLRQAVNQCNDKLKQLTDVAEQHKKLVRDNGLLNIALNENQEEIRKLKIQINVKEAECKARINTELDAYNKKCQEVIDENETKYEKLCQEAIADLQEKNRLEQQQAREAQINDIEFLRKKKVEEQRARQTCEDNLAAEKNAATQNTNVYQATLRRQQEKLELSLAKADQLQEQLQQCLAKAGLGEGHQQREQQLGDELQKLREAMQAAKVELHQCREDLKSCNDTKDGVQKHNPKKRQAMQSPQQTAVPSETQVDEQTDSTPNRTDDAMDVDNDALLQPPDRALFDRNGNRRRAAATQSIRQTKELKEKKFI